MAISDDAEWTTSRIKRLLRPLKCKCLALSSYLKETSTGLTTYGSRRLPIDQGLLPLELPSNVGLRIHFNKNTVQTLDLSKKIFAIRDHYSDIITKAKRSYVGEDAKSPLSSLPLSSLTSLCSVILGAQISCEEDDLAETERGLDAGDVLYDVIPPAYRLRTLLMQALHMILDSCPPHATLYLSLLDLTLNHKLYHESEVLLGVTLDHAFEPSLEHLPRVSNPECRRFLVDLYCKWTTQFPSSVFVRLVVGALQRAPSDVVWTTKATRRFARKLGRHDIDSLPPLLGGLMDTILIHERKCKYGTEEINHLQSQLCEWFDMVITVFTVSMQRDSDARVSVQNEPLVETLLDYCRFWVTRCGMKIGSDLSGYGFIGAFACLYTLWLASGPRTFSKYDVLFGVFQQPTLPPSSYTPICRHIFETSTVAECQKILRTFSFVLRSHGLPQLQSLLWACALYHVEEPEIEQILVDKSGKDQVRDFKLRLIDYVDEAESEYFARTPSAEGPQRKKKSRDSEIPYDNEETTEAAFQRGGGPPISCQLESDEDQRDQLPGPSKRRRIARHSVPTSGQHPLSGSPRLSCSSGDKNFDSDYSCQNKYRDSPGNSARDHQSVSIQFASLLSDAFSSRTSLHIDENRPKTNPQGESDERATFAHSDGSDEDDEVDSEVGDDTDVKNLDLEQHAPSEDFLDLFRVTGTWSPLR